MGRVDELPPEKSPRPFATVGVETIRYRAISLRQIISNLKVVRPPMVILTGTMQRTPEPLHDPIDPPAQDPPSKPLHDPAGDPTYEPPQPVTEPTPNPASDPPPQMPGDPVA